ncbi:MAG: transglutaminase domain-containing protein [Elusimicrobia bacterium]|nr:transglutaminase domain-containing protein [Elusimicrobiota bacterium]
MKVKGRWAVGGSIFAGGLVALVVYTSATPTSRPRTIELEERVKVSVPFQAKEIRLWIPKPPDDVSQSVKLINVASPLPYKIASEPEFGNETVFLKAGRLSQPELQVTLRYQITRRPQESYRDGRKPSDADIKPRGLLAINDEIRRIAKEQTKGILDPLEKGRSLYKYVLKRMAYDKSGNGWGRGDSIYACRIGKGNCTDFHSLFMALAMASGIPAQFQMGFSLPESPGLWPAGVLGALRKGLPEMKEGIVSGYHCWAEFYTEKSGWIPVDISEAWKNPKRADYYFGHLDTNRVLVSTGRDIRLSPSQKGPLLNFLNRPYAEIDGKPFYDIEFTRNFKEIPGQS